MLVRAVSKPQMVLDRARVIPLRRYQRPGLRPLDRSRWRKLVAVTALVDLLALSSAITLATATRFGGQAIGSQPVYGRMIWAWLILWWLCLCSVGLYERHRIDNRVEELKYIVHGVSLGAAVAITGSFFVRFELSRAWALSVWSLGLVTVIAGRVILRAVVRALRKRGHLRRRAVIIGSGPQALALARAVEDATWEGVDVLGFVSAHPNERGRHILGSLESLRTIVVTSEATEVLVAPNATGPATFEMVIAALDGLEVELRIAPGVEGFLPSRLTVHPLGDRPLLSLERAELRPSAKFFKRALDVVFGVPLLIIATPIIALCAIALRIDSKGPIFFRQTRVGVNERAFTVFKLRTMVADAEQQLHTIIDLNEADGVLFKIHDDPRVTRVGTFLRRTSLDELPQLLNVLKGDMSLVGPRPPLPDEVARYENPLRRRMLVKPGITGLWQVSGRNQLTFEDYVRYDMLYVQNWSVALDLFILARTIPAVLLRRGAY